MGLDDRIAALEREVAYIRGIVEQMDKRIASIEARLNHIESELRQLRDEFNRRLDSMFRWMVGLLTGLWATILLTMIPILLRLLGLI